jgi:hypothetical protein
LAERSASEFRKIFKQWKCIMAGRMQAHVCLKNGTRPKQVAVLEGPSELFALISFPKGVGGALIVDRSGGEAMATLTKLFLIVF